MGKPNITKTVMAGAGLVAMVAAAAGAYFLYGSKNAAKNRQKVRSWSLKAKGEILEKLENLKEINEEAYHKIVSEVSDKYQTLKKIDKKDVDKFVKELKGHWKGIAKDIKTLANKKR